jgi:hypothetical protein
MLRALQREAWFIYPPVGGTVHSVSYCALLLRWGCARWSKQPDEGVYLMEEEDCQATPQPYMQTLSREHNIENATLQLGHGPRRHTAHATIAHLGEHSARFTSA